MFRCVVCGARSRRGCVSERKGWSLASVQIDWPQHGRCVIADSPTLLSCCNTTKTGRPCFYTKNSSLTFTADNSLFPSETCSSQVCICQHTIYQVYPCSVNLSRKAPAITRPQEYEQVTRACFGLRPNSPFTNTQTLCVHAFDTVNHLQSTPIILHDITRSILRQMLLSRLGCVSCTLFVLCALFFLAILHNMRASVNLSTESSA